MPSTVEVLADAIKESGTPFIVGHPGGESVELMDAARQRDMRFILMKQEVAGAMLAATWGEITGSRSSGKLKVLPPSAARAGKATNNRERTAARMAASGSTDPRRFTRLFLARRYRKVRGRRCNPRSGS